MTDITITLPDGSTRKVAKGTTALQVAERIGPRLAKAAIAAKVNGELCDVTRPIERDSTLQLITFADEEGKHVFWHSGAHLMAQAVLRLFPGAQLTIGPVHENGFYYDIAHLPFSETDLARIEKEMERARAQNFPILRKVLSKAEAKKQFRSNKYKLAIIDEDVKEGRALTMYSQGEFSDLCQGPHVPSTGYLTAFKLLKTSGAYWRGDAKNDQLQRIYGVAFPSKKELDTHLSLLAESSKRDHRVLGQQLGLFTLSEFSPGAPIFLPKGATIYNTLLSFLREEYRKRGYQEVITPLLYEQSLWETSGHWSHYKDNMFLLAIEGKTYGLKPMNCPSHLLLYKREHHSYRDLPLRIADFAPLHRNELSGTLTGLTRVRKFQQDDAHVFLTPEQIGREITALMDFMQYVYRDIFDFDYAIELSTKPEDALGDAKLWKQAETALKAALDARKQPYKINPGDGAFYGPKIDFHIRDSIGRNWQCGTIQLDFNLPNRFDAVYEAAGGMRKPVVIIHRAVLGSLERFIGVLIEHYAGKFPLWISPEQVRLITVADRFNDYARDVLKQYAAAGIRVRLDERSESVSYKVREAQLEKVNYIMVIGEKELRSNTVTIRTRENKLLDGKNRDAFLRQLLQEIAAKK